MKRVIQLMIIVTLAAALASCKGHTHGQLFSHGDLYANAPGFSDTVTVGGQVLYMLRNIKANVTYTLRTQIAPGCTVRMDIYTSEAAFNSGQPPLQSPYLVETAKYDTSPYDTSSEVVFTAPVAGDYALVVNGISASSGFDTLYLQELRLLSAGTDYLSSALKPSPADPASYTSGTMLISPGYMQVYSSPITSAGTYTYTIILSAMVNSSPAATISYPQMFVYNDASLTIKSLLHSVTSTTTDFIYSAFTTTPATTPTGTIYSTTSTTTALSSAVVSSVPFTSGGPFILLRGVVQSNYTLTVSP